MNEHRDVSLFTGHSYSYNPKMVPIHFHNEYILHVSIMNAKRSKFYTSKISCSGLIKSISSGPGPHRCLWSCKMVGLNSSTLGGETSVSIHFSALTWFSPPLLPPSCRRSFKVIALFTPDLPMHQKSIDREVKD